MGMTLKNASVALELGGAKGSVLLAYPVERNNRFYLTPVTPNIISEQNAQLVASITRKIAKIWAYNNIVRVNTDKPAGDVNTTNNASRPSFNIIAWLADEHIKTLYQKGEYNTKEYEPLIKTYQELDKTEYNPIHTPYLKAAAEYTKDTGIPIEELGTYTSKPADLGGLRLREIATALGMVIVTEEIMRLKAREERKPIDTPLKETRVAVQGYGNAGLNAVTLMMDRGANIVAVSDSKAAIYKKEGLNGLHTAIQAIKEEKGSLKAAGSLDEVKVLKTEDILTLEGIDILVLAAKENVITEENAAQIHARLLSEAANGPITKEADTILKQKGA